MLPTINVPEMVEFLIGLLKTPSPTGDCDRAIKYVREAFAPLPFALEKRPKGFLTGTWTGRNKGHARGFTAHVDTLGAMVQEVKRNGRLRLTQLGGWSWTSVEGEGVTIFTADGTAYRGTFLPTTASVHAHTSKERNALRDGTNMEVRIDAHTGSRAETAALGIRVGDVVAFDPQVERSRYGFIRSRHLDDKAGVACLYGAARALANAGLQPAQNITFHISNYEEVGHGAAAGFPPDLVDLIAIDMAVVAPKQTSSEYAVTICAKDAAGPYHVGLRRELEALAAAHDIRTTTDIYPYYGSDGESYWRAGGDVRVGLIGPGVDASHHVERTHEDALENCAKLIAALMLTE